MVLEVAGDRATIKMERSSACAECGVCHKLAHGARDFVLSAANPPGAGPGDLVRVTVPDINVVRASFAAYGVPTLGAVAGGVLGWAYLALFGLSQEAGAAIGGLLGLAASYYAVSRYDRRLRSTWAGPVITEILHSPAPGQGGAGGAG